MTMVTSGIHRITELFGPFAPGASSDDGRAELCAEHGAMMHAKAYSTRGDTQVPPTKVRDEIAARAWRQRA